MIPRRRIDLALADWRVGLAAAAADAAGRAATVAAFEAGFAAAVGVRHAIATASGRDALLLIIDALGLGAGDGLVVPAYTLGELIPLLQARGLQLTPADVDPESLTMDAASVARAIVPATRAILALHTFGAPCDIVAIRRLADDRGLLLIEDCAHALGAEVDGRRVGGFGRAAFFSLEVAKPLPTYGGGIVTTDDDGLAAALRQRLAARPRREWPAIRKALLRNVEEILVRSPLYAAFARLVFGSGLARRFDRFYRASHDRVRVADLGYSAFQAAIGQRRLGLLADRERRQQEALAAAVTGLPAGFVPQRRDRHGRPCFYNFVTLAPDLDPQTLRRAALACGLDLGVGREVMDDVAAELAPGTCPGAASAYRRAVLLPPPGGVGADRLRAAFRRLAERLR